VFFSAFFIFFLNGEKLKEKMFAKCGKVSFGIQILKKFKCWIGAGIMSSLKVLSSEMDTAEIRLIR
jgi:hypothetical protein